MRADLKVLWEFVIGIWINQCCTAYHRISTGNAGVLGTNQSRILIPLG